MQSLETPACRISSLVDQNSCGKSSLSIAIVPKHRGLGVFCSGVEERERGGTAPKL